MKKKVVILGVAGMLGHIILHQLSQKEGLDVYGAVREIESVKNVFRPDILKKIRSGVDAEIFNTLIRALASIQPDIVINCIGLIKQLPLANDPLSSITVNGQIPHLISLICRTAGARLIHISTDCVFDGRKGGYKENDPSDAKDLYGRTKYLGEVEYPHCITLRTSIIGHELKNKLGLIEWFLAQEGTIKGYTNAIFSGFPTVELTEIISSRVIPNPDLSGLYHVSSEPISKYELLKLIAEKYGKKITIEPDDEFCCDRSLDSTRFQNATGYNPPAWPELIDKMYNRYRTVKFYGSSPI